MPGTRCHASTDAAPARLARAGAAALTDSLGALRRRDDPARFTSYNYGARLSLQEHGAAPRVTTYIQQLDVHKYARLVEERLAAAVLDHLENNDIDTTAFRAQTTAIVNNGTMISGGSFSGGNIGGQGSSFGTPNAAPKSAPR